VGGSKVEAPKPSAEETELNKLNIEIIKRQMADDELLRPFVLSAMKLVETPEGGLRQMTDTEYRATLDPVELQSYENLLLQQERQTKALKGELPLTEALVQQKATEFKNFKEAMARMGNPIEGDDPGSAVGLSTSGIQALKTFNERWGLVEDAERRGELTAGQQTINQTLGVASGIGVQDWSKQVSFPQRTAGTIAGISSAMQPYQYYSGLEYQANAQNAANKAGLLSDIFGTAGTLGGMGLYKYSDPKMKKDIVKQTGKDEAKALKLVKGMKNYDYRYKGEPGSVPKRVGLMANEAPREIVTPDRKMIALDKQVGLLTMATKALANKIERRAS